MAGPPSGTLEDPTRELVDAARRGDLDAWTQLDERFRATLSVLMRGRVPQSARRRFDTEDVMQSAFLRAYKELDSYEYRGEGSFVRWLTQILINRLNSRLRDENARKRDQRREQRYTESQDQGEEFGVETPSQVFAEAEESARLAVALGELPSDEREVITRHLFDRKSLNQVAEELDLTPAAVRRRLARGLRAIAFKLG